MFGNVIVYTRACRGRNKVRLKWNQVSGAKFEQRPGGTPSYEQIVAKLAPGGTECSLLPPGRPASPFELRSKGGSLT